MRWVKLLGLVALLMALGIQWIGKRWQGVENLKISALITWEKGS